MKAACLQLKVEKRQLVSFVTLEPGWVEHLLNKGFDFVLYVDLWEIRDKDENKPAIYKPTTWLVQKVEAPYSSAGKSISIWLPMRFDKINNLSPGKNYFWFTNLEQKSDCSREVADFLMGSGVEMVEMDIRAVSNTVNIDAILAKS